MRVDKYTYVPVDFKDQLEFGAVDEHGYSMSPNSERGDGGICTCLTDFLAFGCYDKQCHNSFCFEAD